MRVLASAVIGLAATSMIAPPVSAAPYPTDSMVRRPKGPRSKYMPHQGAREIARRLRQKEVLDRKVTALRAA